MKTVIQYWFYYPFRDFANDHEGDWEHIDVWLTDGRPQYAQLNRVTYYFHHYRKERYPGQITVVDGKHPQVFVGGTPGSEINFTGLSSGASYWRTGTFADVGALNTDETVTTGIYTIHLPYNSYNLVNITGNELWLKFPHGWGVAKEYFDSPTFEPKGDAPPSPKHNGCWHDTFPPGFSNYSGE